LGNGGEFVGRAIGIEIRSGHFDRGEGGVAPGEVEEGKSKAKETFSALLAFEDSSPLAKSIVSGSRRGSPWLP